MESAIGRFFSGTQTAATKSGIRKLDSRASGPSPGGGERPDPLVMDCLILAINAECDLSSCAEYSSDHISKWRKRICLCRYTRLERIGLRLLVRMMRFSHWRLTNFGSVRETGRRRDCPGGRTFFTRRCSTRSNPRFDCLKSDLCLTIFSLFHTSIWTLDFSSETNKCHLKTYLNFLTLTQTDIIYLLSLFLAQV
jgi:hypothetical protein